MKRPHRLLNGTTVVLSGLTREEAAFLRNVRRRVREGADYFDLYRFACGPGSPALPTAALADPSALHSPLYRVTADLATRAGIRQGLILAPEHDRLRPRARALQSPLSVPQAASRIGITRAAAYKAISEGRLRSMRVGNLILVERRDAEEFRRVRRSSLPSAAGAP